jgi:hypothetical protein
VRQSRVISMALRYSSTNASSWVRSSSSGTSNEPTRVSRHAAGRGPQQFVRATIHGDGDDPETWSQDSCCTNLDEVVAALRGRIDAGADTVPQLMYHPAPVQIRDCGKSDADVVRVD